MQRVNCIDLFCVQINSETLRQEKIFFSNKLNLFFLFTNESSMLLKLKIIQHTTKKKTNLEKVIKCSDVKAVNKAYTAVVIPNAIELLMINGEKYLFSSFVQRDKTLALMHQIWTHAKTNDKSNDANNNAVPLTNKEVYELICQNYGDNLGQISQMEFNLWFGNDCVVDEGEVDVVSVEKDVEIVEDGHDSINTTEQSINEEATLDVSKEQNEQLKTDCSTNLKSDVLDTTTDLTQTTNEQLANSFMLEHNCSCEQHDGMFVVEHEFAVSADAFYNFVFVKTDFIRFLFESRDTYDLVISEWTDFVNNNGNTSTNNTPKGKPTSKHHHTTTDFHK